MFNIPFETVLLIFATLIGSAVGFHAIFRSRTDRGSVGDLVLGVCIITLGIGLLTLAIMDVGVEASSQEPPSEIDATQEEPSNAGEPTPYPDFGVGAEGVTRIPGETRIHTAAFVSRLRFPHESYVDQVIIANGWAPPDALAASMWSHSRPLLFVTENSVPAPTRSELLRYEPRSIVVLGGEGVISERVIRRLDDFIVTDDP